LRSGELVARDLMTERADCAAWSAAAAASGWLGVVTVPLRITGPAVGALELFCAGARIRRPRPIWSGHGRRPE
jgi:hypothetical protein